MKHILIAVLLFPIFARAQTISTIAGTGVWACTGEGIPAVTAAVGQLNSVTTDTNGNIYIGSVTCRQVKKISPSGIITIFVGTGTTGSSGDGGPAILATIGAPTALATDRWGNLYIADDEYNVIRKVNTAGIISTIAGDASVVGGGYSGDGGPATLALLSSPADIAIDSLGNIFIADAGNNVIRKISTSGIITRIAGNGLWVYSGDGGPAISAGIIAPRGIAVDKKGNIYATDNINSCVRQISTTGIITRFAGTTSSGYSGDGDAATSAEMKYPRSLATDKYGNVYIADVHNSAIRRVDTNGIITTFAGNGSSGHSGDGGPAFEARLNYAQDIAIDENGFKYIAEINGAYLRKVDSCMPPNISPIIGDATLCTGMSLTLTDTTMGGTWHVSDTSVGVISPTGVFTGLSKGKVTVTYTKANACATVHATKNIIVGPYAGKIEGWGSFGTSGIDTFCYGASFVSNGPSGGTWGLTDTTVASISSTGLVTPYTLYVLDTVFYATTDTCGSDTAFLPFVIIWCPDQVNPITKEMKINIYPNPAYSYLNISAPYPITNLEIESISGRRMYTTKSLLNELTIDIADFPPGLYLIRVNHYAIQRFVKQ